MFGLAKQSNLGAVVSNPLHLCMRAVLLLVSVPGPHSGPTAHCRGEGTVASVKVRLRPLPESQFEHHSYPLLCQGENISLLVIIPSFINRKVSAMLTV